MRCCLILILLLTQALSLMPFTLTLVVEDIAVDTSQGLRLYAAYLETIHAHTKNGVKFLKIRGIFD